MFFMAWSPVRRANAGRFEVDHPGDYATRNSYHPADGTAGRGKRSLRTSLASAGHTVMRRCCFTPPSLGKWV
jgi:hypothetical protein